jgi:hypothetical protein
LGDLRVVAHDVTSLHGNRTWFGRLPLTDGNQEAANDVSGLYFVWVRLLWEFDNATEGTSETLLRILSRAFGQLVAARRSLPGDRQ